MIEKVWAIWVTGVLQPSLPQDILVDLGLTERPAMVTRALDLLVQLDLADRVQAPGTPLIDVFDRLDRALLILGAPGAGKTTLLLTLARDLLQRAAQDPERPIPVVFPLSSWAVQRRPLAVWLVDELQQRYGVHRKLGQAWIDADQVLPLLDGLDEVQAEHRAACADAINTFRQGHGLLPLAVCSRITEFEALGVTLRLQGAIVVQPLTRAQVDGYLTQIGEPLAAVRQVLQEDPLLWELLDTPLMLTIVTQAYAGQPAEALRMDGTLVERRQSLFATYVNRMFERRSTVTRYSRPQTERWLAWLAWQLTQHGQTSFFLERMQPDWLPVGRHWLPTQGARLLAALVGLLGGLGVGLFGGLAYGLLGGLGVGLDAGLEAGLVLGLEGGLITAFVGGLTGYSQEITPIETVRWSWSKFLPELFLPSLRGLRGRLFVGVLGGLAVGLSSGLAVGLAVGLREPLLTGLTFGLGTGLAVGLAYGLVTGLGGLGGLGVGLFVGLIGGWSAGLDGGLAVGLVAGLGGGLAYGLVAGLGGLLGGLVVVLLSALVTGMDSSPAFWPGVKLAYGLLGGLPVGLLYKLSRGLAAGLSGGEITTKTVPNEGLHRSARMAVSSGLGAGLAAGLLFGLYFGVQGGLRYALGAGLGSGLVVGLAVGLKYGGRACLQHLVLRLALRYDDYIPRRYANFLDYAAERLFLRRVGGGYIFIHRLLQDHFATMYQVDGPDSPPLPPPPPP